MPSCKVKFCVALDRSLTERIDGVATSCKEIRLSRSEVVETILAAFFRSKVDHRRKVKDLVALKRRCALGAPEQPTPQTAHHVNLTHLLHGENVISVKSE